MAGFTSGLVHPNPLRIGAPDWVRSEPCMWRTPVFLDDGDIVVVAYVETLTAYSLHRIDGATGASRWTCTAPAGGYGTPAVAFGQVAMLAEHQEVIGVDLASGQRRWRWRSDTRIRSSVTVDDGRFLVSTGARIVAVDPSGLTEVVSVADGAVLFGAVAKVGDTYVSLAARPRNSGSSVSLLGCVDGHVAWEIDLGFGPIASSDAAGPWAASDLIHAAGPQRAVAVELDGSLRWAHPLDSAATRSIPVRSGEAVMIGTIGGTIHCFDASEGDLRWSRNVGSEGVWSPLSIAGDDIAVVAEGALRRLDLASGAERPGPIAVGHCPYSAVVMSDALVVVGGGDPPYHGVLLAFRRDERPVPHRYTAELEGEVLSIVGDQGAAEPFTADLVALGGDPQSQLRKRSDLQWECPLPASARRGDGHYVIPLVLADGSPQVAGLTIQARSLPRSARVELQIPRQTAPLHSGAAALAGLTGSPGDHDDQVAIRRRAEEILALSGSHRWDIWRLVARQILHEAATTPS